MATCYYYVKDPLENFNLKVVVRESSRLVIRENSTKEDAVFHEDVSISWQEKIDGPADVIRNYSKSSSSSSPRLPSLVHPSVEESYAGAAMHQNLSDINSGTLFNDREKKLLTRITRGQSYKSMHICLATDVNTTAIKENVPQRGLKDRDMLEHVLCTIKLYQNGLLEVTPGLSGPISETEGVFIESKGLSSIRISMSAFLDDNTVERALATGFKLSTSSVRSRNGVEYEYCIQNSNDLLVPFQLEEILKRQNLLDMRSCAINKCSTEHTNWTQDPPAPGRQKVYTVYAEIVSGENFTGKKIFLNYQVQVPQGWDLRTGNINDGVSEKRLSALNAHRIGSNGNGNGGGSSSGGGQGRTGDGMGVLGPSLSGADILALDSYSDGIDARGMLRGTTHTATSKDFRPQRGHSGVTFVLEESARIFLGSSFFIITVISIILGQSYPFWLIPAFVILFTLRTGVPMSTVIVVSVQDSKNKKHQNLNLKSNINTSKTSLIEREQKQEILKMKMKHGSVTYSSNEPFQSIGMPLTGSSIANFNHLINMSFDVKDVIHTHTSTHTHTHTPSAGVFQDTPTIHFQVYSVTGMDRHVLEGYGSFKIQAESGSIDSTVRTWRPQGDLNSKMKEHFLGTAVRFKDPSFVEVPKHCSVLNRFGMFSENSGSLRLRCNVMVTDARTAVMKQKPPVAELESNVRRRTVEDILLAFKATGTLRKSTGDGSAMGNGLQASRLHTARSSMDGEGYGTLTGGELRSKEDRVAEILSRVRSLTKKQDKPNSVSAATATTTATVQLAVSPTAPTSSSRFGDFKHDTGRDSSEEAVWSLVNPMHSAAPKGVKGGVQTDRGGGGGGGVIGGKGKVKGEERGSVLKLSRPHRYGNSSGIEEETEGGSDDGNEKKQDNRGSSSSGRERLQVEVEVEGDRGRSSVTGDDDRGGNEADEKAVSRPKRGTSYSSKDEVDHFDEKRDDKRDFSDKDRLLDH